jgi:hypothetical protein
MSLSERERRELSDLASAAADGSISEQDAARLEQLLHSSGDARAFYVRFMDVSAGMAWAARAQPEPSIAGTIEARHTRSRGWKTAAAAVAVLAFTALATVALTQRNKPLPAPAPAPAGIATLSTVLNVEWSAEEPRHVGNMLKPGWVRIKSGLAQIDFMNGASVWLEGPVEFRLDSPDEGYCAAGKVVAYVPRGAGEFRLGSPFMFSTKNATGFGLEVKKDSRAALHVFRGTVEVTLNDSQVKKELGAGLALTVDRAGETSVSNADPTTFSRQEFGASWNRFGTPVPWTYPAPDMFHSPSMGAGSHLMPPPVIFPGQWKGADPMQHVRDLVGANNERWQQIKKPIEEFLTEQWKSWGLDNNPEVKGVSRAKWDLKFAVENPNSSDEELAKRVQNLRAAREASRKVLAAKELTLRSLLTDEEQSRLVNWGYIP